MNIAAFNDDYIPLPWRWAASPFFIGDVLKAPLFETREFDFSKSGEDRRERFYRVLDGGIPLPFPRFRLRLLRPGYWDGRAALNFSLWVERNQSEISIQCDFGFDELFQMRHYSGDGVHRLGVYLKGQHRFATKEEVKDKPYWFQASVDILASLCWFVVEAASPANVIVSVTPSKLGKSVEWAQSRTHFVVINRKHPANSKLLVNGARVALDENAVARMAHTRRAHLRVLRSPRFRHKVGNSIAIKSCWVGPKEWETAGSIYRLISSA